MFRIGKIAALSISIGSGAVMAATDPYTSDLVSEKLPNLVSIYDAMNGMCRGRSDALRECNRRDAIYAEIQKRGWCWGPENAVGSDKEWIKCPVARMASALPRFDVAAHCRSIASVGGSPSQVLYGGCMQQEQSAYNELKSMWQSIQAPMKNHCLEISKIGGTGSYTLFSGCIQQELKAGKENAETSFDY